MPITATQRKTSSECCGSPVVMAGKDKHLAATQGAAQQPHMRWCIVMQGQPLRTCRQAPTKALKDTLNGPSSAGGGTARGITNSARIGCRSAYGGCPTASCTAARMFADTLTGVRENEDWVQGVLMIVKPQAVVVLMNGMNRQTSTPHGSCTGRPASMAVMPSDQMSALVLYPPSLDSMTSGAIQYGVPTKVRRLKPSVPLSCPATPKSDTCSGYEHRVWLAATYEPNSKQGQTAW